MKIFYTDHFHFPLPADHRFPIEKYSLLRQQILKDDIVDAIKFCVPRAATYQEIVRAHSPAYFARLQHGEMTPKEMRRIGFPWSVELVERAKRSAGATIETGLAAIKEKSDLDIALEDETGDRVYLEALEKGLIRALDIFQAELVIYLAGADPYENDRFGRLGLSKAGLLERDRMVFRYCHKSAIPVAVTMAGGYAKNIQDSVDIHFQTVKQAVEWYHRRNLGLALEPKSS
jgi:acetoin utilization deacetylase AcuC-like enzyme